MLLNGTWRFAYFDRDIDVPETINEWSTIDVPSCWQLRGYDSPNYTNINYPYPLSLIHIYNAVEMLYSRAALFT